MAWVKIDDHFDEHPKMAAVGPLGWGVWLASLAYCNRNLTDGFIPYSVAEGIGGKWRVRVPQENDREQVWTIGRSCGMSGSDMETEWVIDLLCAAGLWEETAGGYLIHDYSDYQPTKEQIEKERIAKAEAGRKGGMARAAALAQAPAKALAQAKSKPDPDPVPDPKDQDQKSLSAEADASLNGKPPKKGGKFAYPDDFEAFWSVYPRQIEKLAAYNKWRLWLRDKYDPGSLIAAAKNYAEYCRQSGRETETVKHPATFLSRRDRHWLEWAEGPPESAAGRSGASPPEYADTSWLDDEIAKAKGGRDP